MEEMDDYVPLVYSSYGNIEHQPQSDLSSNRENSFQPILPLPQGSISQPETPHPESTANTPSPAIPLKHTKFITTTFHPTSYPSAGPVRTPIFSYETGPAFSNTRQLCDLYSMNQLNSYQVQLYAKMDRGFFKADQGWTCYRRNYFQVSSAFDVYGMNYMMQGPEVPCLLRESPESQELLQVDYFSIGMCARVANNTNCDDKIEVVQHTSKRDKSTQMVPEPIPVRARGNVYLASGGFEQNIATFDRLQFKAATANNGKTRATQQYYKVFVDLYAHFPTREKPFRVATCDSAPLVVRGRSPGHYSDAHTHFRQMYNDPSISHEPTTVSSVPIMGISFSTTMSGSKTANDSSLNEDRFRSNVFPPPPTMTNSSRLNTIDHHASPNDSLPSSPVIELGYPTHSGYPYSSLSGYPPIMAAPTHAFATASRNTPPSAQMSPDSYFHNNYPSRIHDNASPGFSNSVLPADTTKHNNYWHQSN